MTLAVFLLLQATLVGLVGVSCIQEEVMLFTCTTYEQ